ncbi:sensor histidine kinase [Streptomyces sp. NPDC055287]
MSERVFAALRRDPVRAPHRQRTDTVITAVTGALAVALALLIDDGRRLDTYGWALLAASTLPLAWRRRRPVPVLLAVVAAVGTYHGLDYNHAAPVPGSLIAVYTMAVTGRPLRTVLIGSGVVAVAVSVMFTLNAHQGLELLGNSGWILAVIVLGVAVRTHRRYIAATVERAERAERTREEEAARRVAEERLRIARDLHDLLAHSITLIGVQTSVAAHILVADPDRLDREAVAKALDGIAETCRTARGELRTTLEVLRADGTGEAGADGPLPDLAALPALVRAARTAGAKVGLTVRTPELRPAVAAAAYRIVQESLTNAVRHAGPDVRVRVEVVAGEDGALRVTVTDDGATAATDNPAPGSGTPGAGGAGLPVHGGPGTPGTDGAGSFGFGLGFGLVGMRERARSVGGTLTAGPRADRGGFEVMAVLPLGRQAGTGSGHDPVHQAGRRPAAALRQRAGREPAPEPPGREPAPAVATPGRPGAAPGRDLRNESGRRTAHRPGHTPGQEEATA